jgi:hypothetical protein
MTEVLSVHPILLHRRLVQFLEPGERYSVFHGLLWRWHSCGGGGARV